jgi:GH15 family glucan-1,4-alpha-glucosidase
MRRPTLRSSYEIQFQKILIVIIWLGLSIPANAVEPPRPMELSRADRPWEFLSSVGQRAGLFGNEAGEFEAWVYPLKILRNFHLNLIVDGRKVPAEGLARTVTVRPESSTILYSGDTFAVRETFFVPEREPGALIIIEVETAQPLDVQVAFERDFQLEWPAGLGGTYSFWEPRLSAFHFGEEQKKFFAFAGSPTASEVQQEYDDNYSSAKENSFHLGVVNKGKETKIVAIAASVYSEAEAEGEYRHLASDYASLLKESADYYRAYLDNTVSVELPDGQLQQAYDWARISVIQGLTNNPFLGTGLIAGYRTSGGSQRPGFAWFFGRDAFWTSLALDVEGDFANTRIALDFISKYQRADGKVPHELSQGANFVPWFTDYPYPYASADATPLYVIAMNEYVASSGDVAFAREKWDSLWKAYQFLLSTYDAQGLPQNFGVGHGWVEGGPLLPVHTELYQSALGAEALRALSSLADLTGKEDVSKKLGEEFARQQALLNRTFWSVEKKRFAFALDPQDQQVDEPSVLATVPMWFGLLDEVKADAMLTELSAPEHEADWGMRIISSKAARYSGGGYHFGSVWPLFTGWASVGEYRYHRALPGFSNLEANAQLALDGSLGHVTEVLSGDYYQPLSTSSPHQIWSAAMVVSPLLRGLFGLQSDASTCRVTLAPHVPADWTWFTIDHVHIGSASLRLTYRKTTDDISLSVTRGGSGDCTLAFSPALSPRAQVIGVEMNGRRVPFEIKKSDVDQHVAVQFSVSAGENTLRIRLKDDFGLSLSSALPPLGSTSQGLRVLAESWTPARDTLTLTIAGAQGKQYELGIWNPAQVASVEGAELLRTGAETGKITFAIRENKTDPYPREKIVIHFTGNVKANKARAGDAKSGKAK